MRTVLAGCALCALLLAGAGCASTERPGPERPATKGPPGVLQFGMSLDRIVCAEDYRATVLATHVRSPDGLAIGPDGHVYVAEENTGTIKKIARNGQVSVWAESVGYGLEGLTIDPAGNVYGVRDVSPGELLMFPAHDPNNPKVLLGDLVYPEGIIYSDGALYFTESNGEDAAQLKADVTIENTFVRYADLVRRQVAMLVTRVSRLELRAPNKRSTIMERRGTASFSGISLSGKTLYMANELSKEGLNPSGIYTHALDRGITTVIATHISNAEGICCVPAGKGRSIIYVASESTPEGGGAIYRIMPDGTIDVFAKGFRAIEDVQVDKDGNLYVTEDGTSLVIKIRR